VQTKTFSDYVYFYMGSFKLFIYFFLYVADRAHYILKSAEVAAARDGYFNKVGLFLAN